MSHTYREWISLLFIQFASSPSLLTLSRYFYFSISNFAPDLCTSNSASILGESGSRLAESWRLYSYDMMHQRSVGAWLDPFIEYAPEGSPSLDDRVISNMSSCQRRSSIFALPILANLPTRMLHGKWLGYVHRLTAAHASMLRAVWFGHT